MIVFNAELEDKAILCKILDFLSEELWDGSGMASHGIASRSLSVRYFTRVGSVQCRAGRLVLARDRVNARNSERDTEQLHDI